MNADLVRLLISHGESFYAATSVSISLEEWTLIIDLDPSLEAISEIKGRNPRTNEIIRISAPNAAIWHGHPDSIPVHITFHKRGLEFQWADDSVEVKAEEIAQKLKANLHREILD